jgi:phosphopantothenoylcysteine decarboxylase/phosphopantothenate--cysteine ligase
MAILTNKRVLLGITGGIAAYKSADLARRLRDAGAEVRVVMTRTSQEFITPLTMQAVSGNPVHMEMVGTESKTGMEHTELARWADAVLVAPAGADFLARLAQGRADDLLTAICLATTAPVAVAPAMNAQMWANPATQANLLTLRRRAVRVFGPGEGDLACGEVGAGRLLEPAELVALTADLFATGDLDGLTVLVTAGPTWEAIDPVRGITNKSSGKMGYAVAEAAAEAGANVILVSGPTVLPDPERIRVIRVTSAQEMHDAVHAHVREAHIFIGVAAVADYRPIETAPQKLKKGAERITLELVKNPDILASVAALERRPFTVGFAAETDNVEQNARKKLVEKRLDLVCVNRVGEGLGFESDTNSLLLIDAAGVTELPAAAKDQLARALVHHISGKYRVVQERQRQTGVVQGRTGYGAEDAKGRA